MARVTIQPLEKIEEVLENSTDLVQMHFRRNEEISQTIPDDFMRPDQDKAAFGVELAGALATDQKLFDLYWEEEAHTLEAGSVDSGTKQLMAMLISERGRECKL